MEKTKYLIGDVANLMGLSRDTLRYYEKRGILSSEKGDNGYRYYTDIEIARLLSILYQRKMDLGLDDITTLWTGDTGIDHLVGLLQNRLEEEQQEIRRHQQTIARLHLTQNDCENIRNHLNEVMLSNIPSAYIIVPHAGFKDGIELWFEYARNYPGLDMMYVYDEYAWQQTGESIAIDYKNSQLVLKQELAEYVDYDIPANTTTLTQPSLCVSSFCVSPTRVPPDENIRRMISWAEDQGLMISHQLYCTFAMQGLERGKQFYYLQLYLPVF